ncbi:MAG: cytochrome b/b6 domain-containing protein [candidate division WOR-3 bacterium]
MKKIVLTFLMIFVIVHIFAERYCPFDEKNDPYPGRCGRYTDENNDSICDLSQDLTDSVQDTNLSVNTENKSETVLNDKTDETKVQENLTDRDTGYYQTGDENFSPVEKTDMNFQLGSNQVKKDNLNEYYNEGDKYFIFVLLPLFLFGMVLIYFSKRKKIPVDVCDINRIVNILLIMIFVPVFFTSLLLVLREYGMVHLKNIAKLVYVHNFTGIIFILLMVLHIYIKLQYYWILLKNLIKKR